MQDLPISGAPLLHSVARLGVFAALVVMAGACAFRVWVLGPALSGWTVANGWAAGAVRRTAGLGVAAAWLLLLAAMLRLLAQLLEFLVPGESAVDALQFLVLDLTWGRAWIAQLVLGAIALAAFGTARRGGMRAWTVAGLATVAACATPAFSGHAAGAERFRVLAITADTVHVLAGGLWIGTLLALVAASALRHADGPDLSETLLRLLGRFSPLALVSSAALAGTGTFAAVLHIPAWADLFGSTYGRVLLVKLVLVGAAAAMGFHHWRRATPALAAGGDTRAFSKTMILELGLASLVLAATALLTASPLPGE